MSSFISLKNVRVHNLQGIDLDLPKKCLIGFCGPSGSGKSSLALNTLFAEGQRRYLDTFSTSERGQLEQPEKPEADSIEGVPPAIAVTRSNETLSGRVTVGSISEINHHFQLAYSRFGSVRCPNCNQLVSRESPGSVVQFCHSNLDRLSIMIGFHWEPDGRMPSAASLVAEGFLRSLSERSVQRIENLPPEMRSLDVLVDRLTVSRETAGRLMESVETAFRFGGESCFVLWEGDSFEGNSLELDGRNWGKKDFSARMGCDPCGITLSSPSPNQLCFNSPAGACPTCEGLGKVDRFLPERIAPNPILSLVDGAFEFLQHDELKDLKKTLVCRFETIASRRLRDLEPATIEEIRQFVLCLLGTEFQQGSRKALNLLAKLRGKVVCDDCQGGRVNSHAAAWEFGNKSWAELLGTPIDELLTWFEPLATGGAGDDRNFLFEDICSRLKYLCDVGVGYLSPNREVSTLSTGERQRVAMTHSLGSNLVNLLYVFDEPCAGLHPVDVPLLIQALRRLSSRGNTVIAVDHDLDLIRNSDYVTEFGPGAGIYGGCITYAGDPGGLLNAEQSLTADYLNGRRGFHMAETSREARRGAIRLQGARGNNLRNVTVEFPLSLLCVVTGPSGSGKSSLVIDTLYPAICRTKRQLSESGLPFESVQGTGAIDEVLLVDQTSIGQTSRSNPATYSKAFDAIRNVFAETVDARARNIKAGRFSFNTDGGRCDACKGEGVKQIDMQFLANLHVRCKFCKGLRYKKEVLNCKYRGRNIADVLNMTVREAFAFFRGQKKVQARLKPMMDVGLDYLRLGQSASTLSSGESQRLKLAGYLSTGKKNRTLFILDEPTIGLHYSDVVKLLDCFDALLAEGHSLIVVEHNRMMMTSADYLVDLGPGAGRKGGQVVAHGPPRKVAQCGDSRTGQVLQQILANELEEDSEMGQE
ncbi:MAG: excinuclease ABC subunit UvrA [Planctomycetota bacterium]|nr:excinuclease ABC subunit UvrA [Planctomycetota bacterium]